VIDLIASAEPFRAEVRAFCASHLSERLRRRVVDNLLLTKADYLEWLAALERRGWSVGHWPREHGGCDWTPLQRFVFEEETSRAGAPWLIPFGINYVGPVIYTFGTAEQKARFLPPIRSSSEWWAQGYSEPSAGSDLAALRTQAVREGDHYVVTGQKIWTTYVQWADWMFCLVRTDNSGKPQNGISFLLLRMDTPGIQIKPLPTLDGPATDEQEINQVFFDNVRVPISNRIGEEGKGWTYAKYLLEFERGNAYAPGLMNQLKKVRTIAAAELADSGEPLIRDRDFQRKLAEMEIRIESLNATELRIFSAMGSGEPVGPASSMLKCAGSEAQQAITELALEAVGGYAAPFIQDTWAVTNEPRPGPDYAAPAAPSYFNYRKASIYAGSNEIQRNIMAKLVLGL
jgi:alkylation response protein AidB-like acyl-CoA dehydrogenase